MRLRVLAVGQKMPEWVAEGVAEYSRRMPKQYSVEWVDIAPAKRGTASPRRYREQEGKLILSRLAQTDHLVALDVSGSTISTEKISDRFDEWQMQGQHVSIVIGGPDGLDASVLRRSAERWSFGRITLPHSLVRVILAEQLYRVWSVQAGHPYHRGN
ncbi:MAG: 23S rRNA (pseudouridine(1915)-N(3))-methyltransferase RlmH [Halieaceae bacterium]|nr:23S rRNA (pseudouridine(1915)-N(3))-methyltransferase RlmH [Halieaceae bacterium]